MEKKGTVDEFFENLPSEDKKVKADIFEKEPEKAKVEDSVVAPEKDEPHKNRRHRRLEQELEREREARIRAEEALKHSEVQSFTKDIEVPDKWLRIYGDNENSRLAWKLQQEIFEEQANRIRQEALEVQQEREIEEQQEEAMYEDFIDSELEAIEDEYGIDITGDSKSSKQIRQEFLTLIEELSPKDREGNIIEYADFDSTFRIYQNQIEKADKTRHREIASRSMEKSGTQTKSAENIETERYLREQGIIR